MFRFESLEIWHFSMEYADTLYNLALTFPIEERFSPADQIKRAAVSIPSNIAEGSGTGSKKHFCLFLDISIRSTLETVSLLHFAHKRNYIFKKILPVYMQKLNF